LQRAEKTYFPALPDKVVSMVFLALEEWSANVHPMSKATLIMSRNGSILPNVKAMSPPAGSVLRLQG